VSRLRNVLNFIALFTSMLLQIGCPVDHGNPSLSYFYAPLQEQSLCRHHLTVVGQDGDRVKARGFTGSVPANAHIQLRVHSKEAKTQATANGRFEVTLPLTTDELKNTRTANLIVNTATEVLEIKYRIREINASLASIVQKNSLQTGSAPNDFVIAYQQKKPFAVIASSLAGELQIIPLDQEPKNGFLTDSKTLHFFPDNSNRPANPFSVAIDEEGSRVAVSLQGQHQVALVDIFTQKIISLAKVQIAQHPQGLLFLGSNLLVAFTNLIEPATRNKSARFAPGMLVRFIQTESELIWLETLELPCQNPTHVLKDNQGQAWVSCAGVLLFNAGKMSLSSPAAFLKINVPNSPTQKGLAVVHQIDLGNDFSPGSSVFTHDLIVAGNSIGPDILLISPVAKNIAEGQLLLVDHEKKSAHFLYAMSGFGDLIFITDFKKDRLLVLDVATRSLNPWPFTHGVPLSQTSNANFFKGPIVLAQRKGLPGVDFQAPDMFALFTLSAELAPLSFLKVMGP
jgi:hypothetical protein